MSNDNATQGGLSLKTLLIAAAASATAAFVVPLFWQRGTVFAAAMTPVIVAVVSELLNRPAEKVTAVTARRAKGGAVVFDPSPPPRADEPFDPLAPAPTEELEALPQTTSQREVHKRPLTGRQWRLAVVTGLIAFVGVAGVVTATELVAGDPVSSEGGRTTFFGGSKHRAKDATPTPTPTPTPEARETPTPTPTPTASPSATATPTATAAPQENVAPQSAPTETPAPAP